MVQGRHTEAPAAAHCPAPLAAAVGDVDPVAQVYPAVHGPLQLLVFSPVVEP